MQPDGRHLDVYQRTAPYGHPAQRPRVRPAWSGSRFRHVPAVQKALPDRRSTGAARRSCRLHARAEAGRAGKKLAMTTSPRASRTPSCAPRSPRLRDRLQADPDLQRLLPRARPRQRRPGHRPDRQGHRRRDRHRRRRRAPGRRARRRHRLLHHRAADRRADHGGATAARWPTSGASTGWRRTRAPPSTASPTCS